MNSPLLRIICLATMAVTTAFPVMHAAEPAIIAKARAYLGSEAALNAVNTLHFTGKLELSDLPADGPQGPINVEITFERDYRQRSTVTSDRGTEITVLNGYDAWQRVSASNDDTRWNLTLLQIPQIKNLRANAFENLSFFRGLEEAGGRIEDMGVTTVDDQSCRKLAFIHSPEVIFYRYFNESTGRLVLTETLRGEQIRESGTMEVAGVKFPKVLTTVATRPDGTTQTVTINFDSVTVNEPVPADAFEMPLLISK
jgi:hypothetical protein